MLKTALIADPEMYAALLNPEKYLDNPGELLPWIWRCIEIKSAVTSRDPLEKGERKILNFGHTAGHAFESLSLRRNAPVDHGIAVAHGLLWEIILSATSLKDERGAALPSATLYPFVDMLRNFYPRLAVECSDIEDLLSLMRHDKKNLDSDRINFTLLDDVGRPRWDLYPFEQDIRAAFDIYMDLLG